MKTRNGFVSNSSSSSFIITNISNNQLSLVDFVKENIHLLDDFISEYQWHFEILTKEDMIKDAESPKYACSFNPKQSKCLLFGDEQGTTLGKVYDYILRSGGISQNWKWKFKRFYR